MSTKAKVKGPTDAEDAPIVLTAEERMRVYSPEEVVELKLLPVTARWLKDNAYARRIPAMKVSGRLRFRLDHILAISLAGDIGPAELANRRVA